MLETTSRRGNLPGCCAFRLFDTGKVLAQA